MNIKVKFVHVKFNNNDMDTISVTFDLPLAIYPFGEKTTQIMNFECAKYRGIKYAKENFRDLSTDNFQFLDMETGKTYNYHMREINLKKVG